MARAGGEKLRRFAERELARFSGAEEVDGAVEVSAVDADFHDVARAELPDRAARERFGTDVAHAGARRNAREARVGDEGNVLAVGEVLQGARHLIGFLHARA